MILKQFVLVTGLTLHDTKEVGLLNRLQVAISLSNVKKITVRKKKKTHEGRKDIKGGLHRRSAE